jgi:DNA-binding response OmpR family regulator
MGDSSGSKKQLGKIMLQQKLVTADELNGMLEEQEKRGGRLASTAAREGRITVTEALRALSEQHGVPAIDLRRQVVPLVNLQLIPVEIAREHMVLPVKVQGEQLLLAMATPQNETSLEELRFVTAKAVFPHVALDDLLRSAIEQAYALLERGDKYYVGDHVTDEELRTLGIARPAPLAAAPGVVTAAAIPVAAPAPPAPPVPPAPLPVSPPSPAVAEPEPARGHALAPPPPPHAPIAPPFFATVTPHDPLLHAPEPEPDVAGVVYGRPPTADGPALDQAFSERPRAMISSRPAPAMHAKRVLIVEDDDDVRRLIRLTLTHVGINCLEADNGNLALEMIRTESPDALVLDAVLPGVHGFDICRRLRGSQRYGAIPIVIVSAIHRGWRLAEDLRAAYGVEHVFEKPIDLQRFARTVRLLLEGEPVLHDDIAVSDGAEAELTQGMAAFEQGDIDSAIRHLALGVSIDPLAFELQYHLGLLHGRREDLFSAIDALETAVRISPRHFSALKNLAVVYQRAGFRHKSVETWDRAMANAPDDETRNSIKEHMMTLL